MKVLVTGSRVWTDGGLIRAALEDAQAERGPITHVIQGGAAGADTLADRAAVALNLTSVTVHADWKTHGKRAGVLRNIRMLEDWRPDVVLAFHPWLPNSKGTKHCVEEARKRGVPVRMHDGDDVWWVR